MDKDKLATGVVVAVLGEEREPGKFYVKQMFYSSPGEPQPQRPLPEKGRYLVCYSLYIFLFLSFYGCI